MATKRTSSKAASETKSLGKTSSKRKPAVGNAHAAVAEGSFLDQARQAEREVKTIHVQKITTFFRNPDGSIGEQSHVYPGDAEAYDLLTNGSNWPRTFSQERIAELVKEGWQFQFVH